MHRGHLLMHTVKLSAVKARADRLNQPEMVDKYRAKAYNKDTSKVVKLTDDDCQYLNRLWDETRPGGIHSSKSTGSQYQFGKRVKIKLTTPRLNEWTIYSNTLRKQGTEQQVRELDRIEQWIKTQSSCGCAGNTKVKQAKKDFMAKNPVKTD